MSPEAQELRSALVAAYPDYVKRVIADRGIVVNRDLLDALDRGTDWLDAELAALLSLPAADQDRSPLEVFRAALSFPTSALHGASVPPVERDAAALALLPGDVYDLAPGGSQQLGMEVQHAHLAWGAAKARAVVGDDEPAEASQRPAVAITSAPATRARIVAAVETAGFEAILIRNPAALENALQSRPPSLAFVDLAHPMADDAIRELARVGVRVIAFGDGVDDLGTVRATALGAHRVVERSRLLAGVAEFIPRIA
jgi:hypothetical protein